MTTPDNPQIPLILIADDQISMAVMLARTFEYEAIAHTKYLMVLPH